MSAANRNLLCVVVVVVNSINIFYAIFLVFFSFGDSADLELKLSSADELVADVSVNANNGSTVDGCGTPLVEVNLQCGAVQSYE